MTARAEKGRKRVVVEVGEKRKSENAKRTKLCSNRLTKEEPNCQLKYR
jgi:hypothetical protein